MECRSIATFAASITRFLFGRPVLDISPEIRFGQLLVDLDKR